MIDLGLPGVGFVIYGSHRITDVSFTRSWGLLNRGLQFGVH
jgi:hypothetical protein